MPDTSKDITFAQELCRGDEVAKQQFQTKYQNLLLWVSKSLDPWDEEEKYKYWIVNVNGKVKAKIPDNTMDAYIFLSKYALRESCKYEGRNDCSFQSYMSGILKGKFCRLEYLRSKKGDYSFTPSCIRIMGENYIKLLKDIRKNVNRDVSLEDLNIDEATYDKLKSEIYGKLSSHGLLKLLENPNVDLTKYMDEKFQAPEIVDTELLDTGEQMLNEEIRSCLKVLVSDLEEHEKKLLSHYWGGFLDENNQPMDTVNKLYRAWNTIPRLREMLEDLTINEPKDFYRVITRITNKLSRNFENQFSELWNEYSLDNPKVKSFLAIYFESLIKTEKNKISSAPN